MSSLRFHRRRVGAITVLAAFLMIVLLGMVAFAIDVGFMATTRTQLQVAADSAAMAATQVMGASTSQSVTTAQQYAAYHQAGGSPVTLSGSDVQVGLWDATSRTFTVSPTDGNAIRVTARADNRPMFFGRVFGRQTFNASASAIAMGNPRDIAFVVDLSGSMNDDTETCWATTELTNQFSPLGYPTVATAMAQQLFTDFGYGTFPGTLQWVGSPAGVAADQWAYAQLTKNGGPLTLSSIASTYRITSSDSESTRKTKAYRWIIDKQIAVVMPQAKPTPSSSTNYNYWSKYLDYVIRSVSVGSSGAGTPPASRGTLPPSQDSDRIDGLNNPNSVSFPSASSSVPQGYRNQIGYRTYVQFMLDFGRDVRPDGVTYTPLSINSPDCPYHNEATAGGTFSFPPSEQPTHSSRRSLIAAIQEIKLRNNTIPSMNQRDWVSIISFDTASGAVIKQPLTGSYDTAMQQCRLLQAVSDTQYSTATESGMLLARQHIDTPANGGAGRQNTQRIVVLVTDGMPNLYSSNNSTINSYISANPNSDFYSGSGNYPQNAALVQSMALEAKHWKVFPVGLGLGCSYDFMDRMARLGATANDNGQGPRTSGNPVAYEQELANIFHNIIVNPQVRLVQ